MIRTRRQAAALNSKPPNSKSPPPEVDYPGDDLLPSNTKKKKRIHPPRQTTPENEPLETTSPSSPIPSTNIYTIPKPFKNPDFQGVSKKIRSLKQILSTVSSLPPDVPTWTSIQASPSIRPLPKYCDVTGLPAPYTDPATGLYFYNAEVYQHIKALSTSHIQRYLAIRNKSVVI